MGTFALVGREPAEYLPNQRHEEDAVSLNNRSPAIDACSLTANISHGNYLAYLKPVHLTPVRVVITYTILGQIGAAET